MSTSSPDKVLAEEPEVIEICVVNYTRAPKTWTIDMPQNYNKVEAGVYGKGAKIKSTNTGDGLRI
ncbi:hypothetical protein C5S39_03445 [Candidatus Methanophagaceae archaeon]|nr:hypothetical protein C5S39_03445 [Methanophagales archaeon]